MNPLSSRPQGRSANIFINYRREDSAGYAGRLFDGLSNHFAGRLFMDVDNIAPGIDFADAIQQAVGSCEVLIVVIGREWLTVTDGSGRRRLDDSADFVRLEVEAALARNVRVIPVLVQDAPMPGAKDLPPSLAALARRNAIELSDVRWAYDEDRLAQTIKEILRSAPECAPTARFRPQAWMLLLAALVLVSAGWIWTQRSLFTKSAVTQPVAQSPVSPTPVGAAPTPATATASPTPAPAAADFSPAQAPPKPRPSADVRLVALKPPAPTTAKIESQGETFRVPQARITSPQEGTRVGKCMKVQGVVSGLGDGQRAFLCIQNPNEAIYPEGELFPSTEGKWSIDATTSRRDFDIFIVIASPEAAKVLGDRNPERSLRNLPEGATIASPKVRVKRQGKVADFLRSKCEPGSESSS